MALVTLIIWKYHNIITSNIIQLFVYFMVIGDEYLYILYVNMIW